MRIEDFIIKGEFPLKSRYLNYEKILNLSENELSIFHSTLMNEYRERDGWWSNGKIPRCSECKKFINSPEDLIRYYGNSLHHGCFKTFYNKAGPMEKEETIRKYWEKILNLTTCNVTKIFI